ncbi:D-amino acid aminotransferase [Pseudomonas monteilii]|uniref:D-amino acid aminotransferase n=1 Tax=Pseudomonas monteilii TaxID=76759 RepID=UPI003D009B11
MMTRTVFLNGNFVAEQDAKVSIFDRGFLMSDAAYEVTGVINGKMVEFDQHIGRLQRTLEELSIRNPLSQKEWKDIHVKLLEANNIKFGTIYIQVTRGNPGDRDFEYPSAELPPTVIAFTQSRVDPLSTQQFKNGCRVITLPDLRWCRRDLKTTQLLYASMAKMAAKRVGADDAWLIEDGFITEGSSSNVFMIANGVLKTRPANNEILHGICRVTVLELAEALNLSVKIEAFTAEEAKLADEVFFTSSFSYVVPVVSIDGVEIGTGKPGRITKRLRELYLERRLAS